MHGAVLGRSKIIRTAMGQFLGRPKFIRAVLYMAFFGAVTRKPMSGRPEIIRTAFGAFFGAAKNHPYGFWGSFWGGRKSSVQRFGQFLGRPKLIRTAIYGILLVRSPANLSIVLCLPADKSCLRPPIVLCLLRKAASFQIELLLCGFTATARLNNPFLIGFKSCVSRRCFKSVC